LTAELVAQVVQHFAAAPGKSFRLAAEQPSRLLTGVWRGEQRRGGTEQSADRDSSDENHRAVGAI